MLPPMFHLFWQSSSHLQNSKHHNCDFACHCMAEHAIVLHFEYKNKDMVLNYVFSKTVSAVNLKRLVMMIKKKTSNGDKENN